MILNGDPPSMHLRGGRTTSLPENLIRGRLRNCYVVESPFLPLFPQNISPGRKLHQGRQWVRLAIRVRKHALARAPFSSR
jgi:hypothetical protein